MTTEIRTLRVSAEMDSSKYAAGAAQKVAADKGMAAAGKEVAAAFTQQDQKVSASGSVLARLSRQYVDGYASAQRFNSAINALTRGVELGKIEMTQATVILDGIYKKYGLMADASQLAQRGQLDLARAVEQANTRLAAQQKITPANQNGVIGRGQAGSFNTANIAAQFQDIAVTSAMGMAPLQIALQQGTQLSMVFEQMKSSGQSAGAALAGAFTSILSPISLVTIGLVAGSAALIQYFSSVDREAKTANEILQGHADAIAALKDRYGEAAAGLQAYMRDSVQVIRADTEERLKAARELVAEQAKVTASYGPGLLTGFAATLKDMNPAIVRDLRGAFADLNLSIQRGEPDILRFREALSRISGDSSIPESIRKMAEEYRQFDEETLKLAKSIPGMVSSLDLMEGSANRQTEAINRLSAALRSLSEIGVAPLTELQQAERLWQEARRNARNRDEIDDADRMYRDAQRRISDRNPTVTNSDGRTVPVPTPENKPSPLGGDPDRKAETEAQRAANAYRDLIKSANDRVAQMRLEAEVSGQTGIAAQTMRFELDLLQKAQEKGRTVTEAQREQIKGLAEDYRAAAEAAAKAKLQQDLMFEREQLFRSASDQAVAARLKGAGLSVNLQSQEAQMMRENMRLAETKAAIGGFFSDFNSELLKGGSDLGKRLADVLANALLNQTSKLTERIFENLTNALVDAFSPGTGAANGGGGIIGSLLSRGAPVAVNDNAVSGAADLFRKAISSIESGGNYGALGPITRNGDRAYGRFQVMGNNVGPWSQAALGRTLTPSQFLADPGAQDAIFDHRFGSYVSRYGATGAAKAWFGGPGAVSSNGAATDVLGTSVSQYAAKFDAAVDRMTTSATSATGSIADLGSGLNVATQGLGQLGNGLGQFGNNLANLFPAAPSGVPGGGGLGMLLGNLWGNLTNGPGTQWATAIAGGFTPGLFADGTPFAPGGMAIVGERGRELVNLPRGSQVIPNHNTERLLHAANGNGGGSNVEINIINNAGAQVTQRERRTANGGKAIDVMIDEAVAQKISTPGSHSRGAMQGQFGLKSGLARR